MSVNSRPSSGSSSMASSATSLLHSHSSALWLPVITARGRAWPYHTGRWGQAPLTHPAYHRPPQNLNTCLAFPMPSYPWALTWLCDLRERAVQTPKLGVEGSPEAHPAMPRSLRAAPPTWALGVWLSTPLNSKNTTLICAQG